MGNDKETDKYKAYDGLDPKQGMKGKKVLVLGNGILRSYIGGSWDDLLKNMKDYAGNNILNYPKEDMKKIFNKEVQDIPYRFKPVAVSYNKWRDFNPDEIFVSQKINKNEKLENIIKELIKPFDIICTTNYGYDIEEAVGVELETETGEVETKKPDSKEEKLKINLTKNYKTTSGSKPIFHIHGEINNPDSIVLDEDDYFLQTQNIRNYVKSTGNAEEKPYSWVDYFLQCDVYFVGFGLDFSESDIWWLIDEKRKGKKRNLYGGKIYVYDAEKTEPWKVFFDSFGSVLNEISKYQWIRESENNVYFRDMTMYVKTERKEDKEFKDYRPVYEAIEKDVNSKFPNSILSYVENGLKSTTEEKLRIEKEILVRELSQYNSHVIYVRYSDNHENKIFRSAAIIWDNDTKSAQISYKNKSKFEGRSDRLEVEYALSNLKKDKTKDVVVFTNDTMIGTWLNSKGKETRNLREAAKGFAVKVKIYYEASDRLYNLSNALMGNEEDEKCEKSIEIDCKEFFPLAINETQKDEQIKKESE